MQGWEDLCFLKSANRQLWLLGRGKIRNTAKKTNASLKRFFFAGIRLKGKVRNSQKWLRGFYSGAQNAILVAVQNQ